MSNNLALVEDPDYAKAMHRMILIKEANGAYHGALEMANYAIMRFEHPDEEDEDPDNYKVVPALKEL